MITLGLAGDMPQNANMECCTIEAFCQNMFFDFFDSRFVFAFCRPMLHIDYHSVKKGQRPLSIGHNNKLFYVVIRFAWFPGSSAAHISSIAEFNTVRQDNSSIQGRI